MSEASLVVLSDGNARIEPVGSKLKLVHRWLYLLRSFPFSI